MKAIYLGSGPRRRARQDLYSRPGKLLRRPWHGWEFDIKMGHSCVDPSAVRVKRSPVGVECITDGYRIGPYQAEEFPTSVELAYVVLN